MKPKSRQLLLNVIGSIVFLSLPILFSPDLTNPKGFFNIRGFQRDFIGYVLLFLFFYLNYLVLLPKLFFKKKIFLYILCLLGCFAVITLIPSIDKTGGHIEHFPKSSNGNVILPDRFPYNHFFIFDIKSRFFQFMLVFTFSLLLKTSMRLRQTEKEKLNAELSYLKAQINPHFLFNTLNSIYSLAINKSEETAEAVVKLSGMMRYVISEANQHFVSLEKEINYLSNYIELQKIRLEDTVKIIYTLEGSADGKQIAPLVLIPFIENAFKHGVNPEENSRIEIALSINGTKLRMVVLNNKVTRHHNSNLSHGVGIENATSRLQLLYPGKHLLVIDENKEHFKVELTVEAT